MNTPFFRLLIFFSLLSHVSFSQFSVLKNKIANADTFATDHPKEKIFVHYDRPYYQLNDTIWLKGYIVFAKDNTVADSSKIAYIDIINETGIIIKRQATYAEAGLFFSNVLLSDDLFNAGNYTLRAYTNHMRNYGDTSFFESHFRIIYSVFNPPKEETTNRQITSRKSRENKRVAAVPGNEPDLQFMPEGGSLIAGKKQQLGFKAISRNGMGTVVKGIIQNSRKDIITNFSAVYKGMGTVWLQPQANEIYTAVLDNGAVYKLPAVQSSGVQLQVINDAARDSVEVIIDATADLYNTSAYFFRASARGISFAMGTVRLKEKATHILLPRNVFPQGVCRFTLYNSDSLPVNERVILNWNSNLRLSLTADKTIYANRDSIHVSLDAVDSSHKPVAGSFSVAVIDTGFIQYNNNADNIISYLVLSSELKGMIEDPFYYFNNPATGATEALMLTQGWVQYDYNKTPQKFNYEKEFSVKGRVTNILNKPVAKSKLTLFGKDGTSVPIFMNTETNDKGDFLFNNFPGFVTDSVNMIISALNKKGKSFGIGIDVEVPGYPEYKIPTILNTEDTLQDSGIVQYQRKQIQLLDQLKKDKKYLPEVIIRSKTKVPGSKNLNRDGGADDVITKNELEKTPKESLLDVLTKKMPGFYKGTLPKSTFRIYKQHSDVVVFVIDGYNINKQYVPVPTPYPDDHAFAQYEETFLRYINAEDIAGIEIMSTSKNSIEYEAFFNMYSSIAVKYVFVEITTYSGNGAFSKKIPGTYLYKPLAPVLAKTFYSPRYSVAQNDFSGIDYRSTLYWNPLVITNEKGKAEFSFFSSDSKNGLLVIVQGTDFNGGLGVGYLPLVIDKGIK